MADTLAKAHEVSVEWISRIIKGQRGITGDTTVCLATTFNMTAEFRMNLQKA